MAKSTTTLNFEEMSLLGEKLALMKTQNIIIEEIITKGGRKRKCLTTFEFYLLLSAKIP